MAKHNCAICGAEVGLISEQKLADGNFICRKVCSKKTFKIFDKVEATLGDVTAHIEQVEKGTKIWNELLLPLKKTKDKDAKLKSFGVGSTLLYVSPSTGLVAVVETRRKIFIFGKTELACVYRLADLVQYDYEEEKVKNSDGKNGNQGILPSGLQGHCRYVRIPSGSCQQQELREYGKVLRYPLRYSEDPAQFLQERKAADGCHQILCRCSKGCC